MKISQLKHIMIEHNISVPEKGTGRNGQVVARDLETAIGQHFLPNRKYNQRQLEHLKLRLACPPMKAYRYDKLKPVEQNLIWESSDWYAEEKYNGWRIQFTLIEGYGIMAWGANLSEVDFLPVDYTKHILLDGIPLSEIPAQTLVGYNLIDTECVCHDDVETKAGLFATNTLDAVKAVLGSTSQRARELQRDGGVTLQFHVFDVVSFDLNHTKSLDIAEYAPVLQQISANARKSKSTIFVKDMRLSGFADHFPITKRAYGERKKRLLHKVWRKGGEGVIVKHLSAPYEPGSRLRTHAIKVKRTMSGEIGDDIDAFVSEVYQTEEWESKGLIGGVALSVILPGEEVHEIARVTSMPDNVRELITHDTKSVIGKVLVVDGQELSAHNKKLMHAKVDWVRGFRDTKSMLDCTFSIDQVEEVKF